MDLNAGTHWLAVTKCISMSCNTGFIGGNAIDVERRLPLLSGY